ncbi:MAG: AAA family ATPase [Acidobacteriota bacterium]
MAKPEISQEQLRSLLLQVERSPNAGLAVKFLQEVRGQSRKISQRIDRMLVERVLQVTGNLKEAAESLKETKALLDQICQPPWWTGIYLDQIQGAERGRGLVWCNHETRVVTIGPEVDVEALTKGCQVFVSKDFSLILGVSDNRISRVGPTAVYDRRTEDGRLVLLDHSNQEVLADAAAELAEIELEPGDRVRWDRRCGLAYERIPSKNGSKYLVDRPIEHLTRASVGGCRHQVDELLGALTISLTDPDKARAYGLEGKRAILMAGPPGCGKTLMARVAAAEIGRRGGKRCHFFVVKPAQWYDPFVGVSEQNIRQTFSQLAKAAEQGPAVLFLDEVDSIGRSRGGPVGYHSDRFLTALLAEIDGFEDLPGVAIIAATNRKDLLDPALRDRLSDIEIQVPRPGQEAARAIFNIHLPETAPFSPDGQFKHQTRQEIIEAAVSRLYAPNGDNELCELHFRDATRRVVAARELVSGRLFRQICWRAAQKAFFRDVFENDPGIRVEDMEAAVVATIQRLATTLTPQNARQYLSDLPDDLDVVRVQSLVRRAGPKYRYLEVS